GSHSRLVAYACDAEFCLMSVETDSTDQYVFHAGSLFFGNRPAPFGKAGSHFEFNAEFFGKLYRARLHYLCAATRHLEHLVIGNLADFLCIEDDAGIACEHTINVGKNLARVGVQRAREPNRG